MIWVFIFQLQGLLWGTLEPLDVASLAEVDPCDQAFKYYQPNP